MSDSKEPRNNFPAMLESCPWISAFKIWETPCETHKDGRPKPWNFSGACTRALGNVCTIPLHDKPAFKAGLKIWEHCFSVKVVAGRGYLRHFMNVVVRLNQAKDRGRCPNLTWSAHFRQGCPARILVILVRQGMDVRVTCSNNSPFNEMIWKHQYWNYRKSRVTQFVLLHSIPNRLPTISLEKLEPFDACKKKLVLNSYQMKSWENLAFWYPEP